MALLDKGPLKEQLKIFCNDPIGTGFYALNIHLINFWIAYPALETEELVESFGNFSMFFKYASKDPEFKTLVGEVDFKPEEIFEDEEPLKEEGPLLLEIDSNKIDKTRIIGAVSEGALETVLKKADNLDSPNLH